MNTEDCQLMDSTQTQDSKPKESLDTSSGQGMTSLLDTTVYGDLLALKALVSSGQPINVQNAEGKTPLAIACYQGWYEGVVFLLANGSDQMIPDNKRRLPIHAATHNSKIRCLALLAQHLQPKLLNSPDCEMMTALHWAAYHDRPEHVQLLMSKGVNAVAVDCDGKTALHWASQIGNDNCAEILVREARGTNLVNIKDNSGKGAIHYAAAAGHAAVIKCLTNSKVCNIYINDPEDRQPLHWSAAMGRTECVELLLELGADPNMHDVSTKNALYYAKKASHKDCVILLMEAMKQLHIAKRDKLKAMEELKKIMTASASLSASASRNKQAKKPADLEGSGDNSKSELNADNSSQTNEFDSSETSQANPSSNVKPKLLPPIRGSKSANKADTNPTDPVEKAWPQGSANNTVLPGISETGSRREESSTSEPHFAIKEEKSANSAMKFIPTSGLYHQS